MNTILNIDALMLNKIQQICDWFQDWFGIDNFTIAKIVRIIVIIFFAILITCSFLRGVVLIDGLYFFTFSTMIFFFSMIFKEGEENCKNNPSFGNPLVIKLGVVRSILLLLSFVLVLFLPKNIYFLATYNIADKEFYSQLESFILGIRDILFSLYLYFGSCTPKPPKTSKVKKLLGKEMELFSPSPSPAFSVIKLR